MTETIESVAQWADETFGPSKPRVALERAIDEVHELLDDWREAEWVSDQKFVEEAADVCITLYRYIYLVDKEAINKKMAVNRKRVWKLNGDGTAQHLKDERETNP